MRGEMSFMDKRNHDELVAIGYFSSFVWVFLQIYRMIIGALIQSEIIAPAIKQSTSVAMVLISLIGFWGVSIISGVFAYRGPLNQKPYWVSLSIAEFIGAPINYWNAEINLLWGVFVSGTAAILSVYSFYGFLKLRKSISSSYGTKKSKNAFNILVGIGVVTFLVLWRVSSDNARNF